MGNDKSHEVYVSGHDTAVATMAVLAAADVRDEMLVRLAVSASFYASSSHYAAVNGAVQAVAQAVRVALCEGRDPEHCPRVAAAVVLLRLWVEP